MKKIIGADHGSFSDEFVVRAEEIRDLLNELIRDFNPTRRYDANADNTRRIAELKEARKCVYRAIDAHVNPIGRSNI